MRKVLIFTISYYPEPVGGAEVAMKEITDRISPDEIAFHMITPHYNRVWPKIEQFGNVTIHRIGFSADNPKLSDRNIPFALKLNKFLFPITACWYALKLHRKYQYDATWAMLASYAAYAALFFKYLKPSVPYLLELQDGNTIQEIVDRQPLIQKIVLKITWFFYRRTYLKADVIKVLSQFILNLAKGIGYQGHIEVIPNAVDVAKFTAPVSDEKIKELHELYGKKEGDVFLFTASRLVLSRGVEEVILSLPHLPKHVKFLVAGSGDDLDKLQKIAEDAGVTDRVIWAGHKTHDDLPALIKASDIFVRPSIIEGFGNSFVEAMAAEIPIVGTEVGGIPDFLFDPEKNPDKPTTGVFCEVRNPESVAKAVQKLIDDPELYQRIVVNAKALVEEKYDWSTIVADMKSRVFEPLFAAKGK